LTYIANGECVREPIKGSHYTFRVLDDHVPFAVRQIAKRHTREGDVQLRLAVALLAGVGIGAAVVQALHAQAKPPAYIITEFEIIDQVAIKEFSAKVAEVVKASGAKYLIHGGQIVPLEGDAPKRFTVQVFDNMERAQAFRSSAAWKELTPLREKALKQRSFIAEGVD
jgi:uncharacterized protein (DUF1330 family)